jgi:putative ABC transport system permease protein
VPDRPFNYTFLDDQYTALYRSEQRTTVLISTFSFIAIVVAALGLFGLSTFTSLQRAKEISIRKVLGATFSNIIILINRGYLRLLFISFVITLPLSFWAMTAWLENFAYRISISAWHYVLAFGLVLLVSSITVAFQSIKVSVVNPVRYLRGN